MSTSLATKLDAIAVSLQPAIDKAFGNRQTNTPKRARQAASSRLDGNQFERAQQAARALAAAHRAGTVPPELMGIITKKAIHHLSKSVINRDQAGYYDAGIETNKPYYITPEALALWELIGGRSPADMKADTIREAVNKLQFSNIDGYFPTPPDVVQMMLNRADIKPEHNVLEPSAGSGNIMDAIEAFCPTCGLVGIERHLSLVKVLNLKGYIVEQGDFMERTPVIGFDRILMNPPFERGQDMDHVQHAFKFLKPDGRLIAIMSPGAFFRADRKTTEFRAWFESRGGEAVDIPPGAFKNSGTNIASVIVELRN